jgi:hypothetical protein
MTLPIFPPPQFSSACFDNILRVSELHASQNILASKLIFESQKVTDMTEIQCMCISLLYKGVEFKNPIWFWSLKGENC